MRPYFDWDSRKAAENLAKHGVSFEEASTVFGDSHELITMYQARGRLRNALILTLRACSARDWQVGVVCFAAAAETILNYSQSRKIAESRFRRLYRVRSDIVHGRAYDRKQRTQNLKDLASFSNLMRQLWRVVIRDTRLRAALDGEIGDREKALAPAVSRLLGG